MAVPILAQGRDLVVSVPAALTDAELLDVRDRLLADVGRRRSRGVVVDVSALEVMDSFATRTLRGIASMLRLRGVDTVIVGIQPGVALAMVQLGLTMTDVPTALDLDEGLAYFDRRRDGRRDRGG